MAQDPHCIRLYKLVFADTKEDAMKKFESEMVCVDYYGERDETIL